MLRNFLARIPRTVVPHHAVRASCWIFYSASLRTRRTFSKNAIDYYSKVHFVLFVLPVVSPGWIWSIPSTSIHSISVGMTDSLVTRIAKFSIRPHTRNISPQNDRYFHQVDTFPASRVPRRSTLELTHVPFFFFFFTSVAAFFCEIAIYQSIFFSNTVDRFFFNRILFCIEHHVYYSLNFPTKKAEFWS